MVMRFEVSLNTRCWSEVTVLAEIFEFCLCALFLALMTCPPTACFPHRRFSDTLGFRGDKNLGSFFRNILTALHAPVTFLCCYGGN